MESKQEMNGKFSVESRLADLGFPVEDDEECWEEKENGYLYLLPVSPEHCLTR